MKTATITVYRFSELSPAAQERAKMEYAQTFGYPWADEAIESLSALAKAFGSELKEYEIDFFGTQPSYARFSPSTIDKGDLEKIMQRLKETCPLTGFCADEDALDGLREAYGQGVRDIPALLQSAFRSWLRAARKDCEYLYSDDAFSENSDSNDWWYFADGNLFVEKHTKEPGH